MTQLHQQILLLIVDTNWPAHLVEEYTTKSAATSTEQQQTHRNVLHFRDVLNSICMFIRAFEMLADARRVAIVAMNSKRCGVIYERKSQNYFLEASEHRFAEIELNLLNYLEISTEAVQMPLLSSALSIGLCYLNKIQKHFAKFSGQILLVDRSTPSAYSSQYIPLMNAAFTASKHGIIFDVCALSEEPSSIPEQLVDMTGGVYVNFTKCLTSQTKLEMTIALSELLLFHFLPSKHLRNTISTIKHQDKANTAVCFCHHQPVEICAVCSCCLAIYCSDKDDQNKRERTHCKVCRTRFTRCTIQDKQAGGVLF